MKQKKKTTANGFYSLNILKIENRKIYDYSILLSKKAKKQLDKPADHIEAPILDAFAGLEENPTAGREKLKGRASYRIRFGYHRVIFDAELIVDIITLGSKKDI